LLFDTPDDDPNDGGPGAGGAGGAGGGGGGTPKPADPPSDPPPVKTYTVKEFKDVTKERDRAKQKTRALLSVLGVANPDEVSIRFTDDPDQPVVVEGLDEITELIERGRNAAQDANPAERRRQQAQFRQRIETPLKKEIAALKKWVEENAVIEPIRRACRNQHIVDDDGGQFADVVQLLRPRMPVRVEFDGDHASVFIDSINEQGDPLRTGDDEPFDAEMMVAELAKRKPKFKQADYRPGPGAGGQDRRQGGNGKGVVTPAGSNDRDYTADAVAAFTGGIRPQVRK
jgi:hypothetical protein